MRRPTILSRQEKEKAALGQRMSAAAYDVLKERARQISGEGWTLEHDNEHTDAQLPSAALCYVYASIFDPIYFLPRYWPWDRKWWKPSDSRRNLVKAAALIVAEIERIDRASSALPSRQRGCE